MTQKSLVTGPQLVKKHEAPPAVAPNADETAPEITPVSADIIEESDEPLPGVPPRETLISPPGYNQQEDPSETAAVPLEAPAKEAVAAPIEPSIKEEVPLPTPASDTAPTATHSEIALSETPAETEEPLALAPAENIMHSEIAAIETAEANLEESSPVLIEEESDPDPEMLSHMSTEEEWATRNARREKILEQLGDKEIPLAKLLKPDAFDGPIAAGNAIEAYANGENLRAVLFAHAALGADPGNKTRRRMLQVLIKKTGIPYDPHAILPMGSLIHQELSHAETAFFEERFGEAIQRCRRALLLNDRHAEAWVRLGSAHYAAGEPQRAKEAYRHALALKPNNQELRAFMLKRGWDQ